MHPYWSSLPCLVADAIILEASLTFIGAGIRADRNLG